MQIIKYFFDEIKSFKDNININIKKEISLLKEINEIQQQKIKECENQIKNLNNRIDKYQNESLKLINSKKSMRIISFIFIPSFIVLACIIMYYTFKNNILNIKEESKRILDNYILNNTFQNDIINMKEENKKILKLIVNYNLNDSFKIDISNIKEENKELLKKINILNEKIDLIFQNYPKKEEKNAIIDYLFNLKLNVRKIAIVCLAFIISIYLVAFIIYYCVIRRKMKSSDYKVIIYWFTKISGKENIKSITEILIKIYKKNKILDGGD